MTGCLPERSPSPGRRRECRRESTRILTLCNTDRDAASDRYPTVEDWEPVIANISRETGCDSADDLLACLRQVPTEQLSDVFNSSATTGAAYGAVLDGDWFTAPASTQLESGAFVHVPFIIGCNTDEGAGNIADLAPNSTEDMIDYLQESYSFNNGTIQDLAVLYPDIPQIGIPATYPGRPNTTYGSQFKRVAAVQGDLGQEGPRRYAAQEMTRNGAKVYTYRFNVLVRQRFPFTSIVPERVVADGVNRSTASHGCSAPCTSRKSPSSFTTSTAWDTRRTCCRTRWAASSGRSTSSSRS